ncbi:MAG: cytidylate kinase family protein [Candidatus Micrarchaeota archaeon]|nr:cytidylate kinase family protein [Candidatus Micrarchaeota archaeon]MDE1847427.1 cytidylate kinase family protein [Candidatus Micrarchaeota archaeon]MDE1864078.1 cytidylate kinase family protein [Candidatus Micrarchaeota archaeon]
MEAIIICGLPASGKTTVAALVAKKLHIRHLGGTDILKEMAAELGYKMSGDDWWDTDEGIRFSSEREGNPELDNQTDKRMLKEIEEGDVVVTSYTAPWLSKVGFKCWLSASKEKRAQRMAKRDHTTPEESAKVAKVREEENHRIYKELYGINFGEDMRPFDLEIDTDAISAELAAEMIVAKFKKRNKAK